MSRTLVAGIGNIFLGDDGFGSVVARHLAQTPLPPDVEVVDIGIRGVHLAYQLLDGYDTLVLIDAMRRGEAVRHRHRVGDLARRARPVR